MSQSHRPRGQLKVRELRTTEFKHQSHTRGTRIGRSVARKKKEGVEGSQREPQKKSHEQGEE